MLGNVAHFILLFGRVDVIVTSLDEAGFRLQAAVKIKLSPLLIIISPEYVSLSLL
jgi:hypothetical protein